MPVVKTTVQINRRPEEVWSYLADFNRHAEWSPKSWKMESLTEGPVQVGSKFRSPGWVPRDANHVNDAEVTAMEPPRRLAFSAMEKGQVLSGGSVAVQIFNSITDMYGTPQAAHNLDTVASNAPAFFVASWPFTFTGTDSAHLTYRTLTWSGLPGSRTASLTLASILDTMPRAVTVRWTGGSRAITTPGEADSASRTCCPPIRRSRTPHPRARIRNTLVAFGWPQRWARRRRPSC